MVQVSRMRNLVKFLVRETWYKKFVYKLHPSFSYRIEHCSNSSKFLAREKLARELDTRANFLYQDSCTSFLYKKLGPSAISLTLYSQFLSDLYKTNAIVFITILLISAVELLQST